MPHPRSAGLSLLRATAWPLLVFLMSAAALWWFLPARPAFTLPGNETFLGFSTRGHRVALVSIRKVRDKDGALYHEGPVRVRDVTTGRQTVRFAGGERRLHRVMLSPTGSVLATQEWSESMEWTGSPVRLWDVGSGRRLAEFQAYGPRPERTTVGSCFSPDDTLFAYLAPPEIGEFKQPDVKAIAVWDIAGGRRRALIKDIASYGPFAFSPDGQTLAASAGRMELPAKKGESPVFFATVRLRDVGKGVDRAVLSVASATSGYLYVQSLCFSPDGRTLATGTTALTPATTVDFPAQVKLWDAKTGLERVKIDTRQYGGVSAIKFTADGRFMLAKYGGVGFDPTQYAFYDLTSNPPRQVGELFGTNAFNPDRGLVASSNVSDLGAFGNLFGAVLGVPEVREKVTLLKAARGEEVELCGVDGRGGGLRPLDFSPDGQTLAVGESNRPGAPWYAPARWFLTDQRVRLYDVPGRRPGAWSPGADDARFSPDGTTLVTSGSYAPVVTHSPDGDPVSTYVRRAPVRAYSLPARPDPAVVFGASAVAALVAFGSARVWGALRSRGATAARVVALVASGFVGAWWLLRRSMLVIVVVSVLAIVFGNPRRNRYQERAAEHRRTAKFYDELAEAIEYGIANGDVMNPKFGTSRLPDGSAVRVVGRRPNTRIYYPPDAPTPADYPTTRRLIQVCRRESSKQDWRKEQCERAAFRPWLTVKPDPPPPPGPAHF